MTPRVVAIVTLAASLVAPACQRSKVRPVKGQNLLLITVDTLRADRLGAYGYSQARTPNLDGLAERGVLFGRVTTPVPITLPSHASLFTGLAPPTHGVRDNTHFRLDAEAETLAEILSREGYDAAAFVGAFVLDHSFGLDQGFTLYDDDLTESSGATPGTIAERKGELVARSFESWLGRRNGDAPFFAWLHFFDPHLPYAPPAPYPPSYDGEVAYVDAQIGRVLEALAARGLRESTLVVVTSDHGESLGEHGEKSHGFFVYDATLRVPLIFESVSALPRGERIDAPVRTLDVLPTVLDVLGLPPAVNLQGTSLIPLIGGAAPGTTSLPAYAECYAPQLNFGWAPLVALSEDGYKYIEAPRAELYDLENDPGETTNLIDREPDRARKLRAHLGELLAAWPDSLSSRLQPDPRTLERLRSLGYTSAGVGDVSRGLDDDALALPDPKDRLGLWTRIEEVILAQAAGHTEEATRLVLAVLEEDPTNLLGLELLAGLRARAGDRAAAVSLYEKILGLDDTRPLSHVSYGNLLWQSGDLEGAESSFRAALERDPGMAAARRRLGELYLSTGRAAEAKASFEAAAAIDASDPRAALGLARAEEALGNLGEASSALEALHRAHPSDPEILTELAKALARADQVDRAVSLLEGGPDHPDVHYTLSVLYRAQGKMAESLAELERTLALAPDVAPALHDRGVLLSRVGRLPEAIDVLSKALAVRDLPATRNALGTALCRMERCGEAIPHFERAVADAPDFVEALENLAQAYWIVGRKADAERIQRKAEAAKAGHLAR